jgi:hypothetical protein
MCLQSSLTMRAPSLKVGGTAPNCALADAAGAGNAGPHQLEFAWGVACGVSGLGLFHQPAAQGLQFREKALSFNAIDT